MKTFGDNVLAFYNNLSAPVVPDGVEVLYPQLDKEARKTMSAFYKKFYNDNNDRTFLIGINPGRFGAGTTGVPFTDPIRLTEVCGIANNFADKPELSSRFIYKMIDAFGPVSDFFRKFYITSVSPLGFTRNGKNLNYYDLKEIQTTWEPFMVDCLMKQREFGSNNIAFSLGQGKNQKYLEYLNQKYRMFDQIIPLPHPRWVMQYRLKRLDEFINLYLNQLKKVG